MEETQAGIKIDGRNINNLRYADVTTLMAESEEVTIRLLTDFLVAQMVKRLPTMRETQVQSLGWEDPPGEGKGNPLQYSCLENPMGSFGGERPGSRESLSRQQVRTLRGQWLLMDRTRLFCILS